MEINIACDKAVVVHSFYILLSLLWISDVQLVPAFRRIIIPLKHCILKPIIVGVVAGQFTTDWSKEALKR